jgi:hypothetical protein
VKCECVNSTKDTEYQVTGEICKLKRLKSIKEINNFLNQKGPEICAVLYNMFQKREEKSPYFPL